MRKVPFVNGEFYHVYNRGVDKRDIFSNQYDLDRFFQSMNEFNVVEPIGSIFELAYKKKTLWNLVPKGKKLVDIICYCLNPNHYHFILTPLIEHGIEKFMHKIGIGHTNYFNEKYKRSGALFQGTYKAIHIDSNEYLLHLSAYVNLNNQIHQLGNLVPKLVKSSWEEYTGNNSMQDFCKKDMILGQFNDDIAAYKIFAEETADGMMERRREDKKLDGLLLE